MSSKYAVCGEDNGKAELTDSEVDLVRSLFEEDEHKPRGERYWTTHRLSLHFEISRSYVARIVRYKVRNPKE